MIWTRMLAYITGTVDQELLLRNEYLTAENRILRAKIKGQLLLSDSEKTTNRPSLGFPTFYSRVAAWRRRHRMLRHARLCLILSLRPSPILPP